jgi:hypothetical protein
VDKIKENDEAETFLSKAEIDLTYPSDILQSTLGAEAWLLATREGWMGLMPYNAQKNNILFQFQGSDVVAVVRVEGQHQLKIVGRAVLANDTYIEELKFRLPLTSGNWKHIEMYLDMRILHQVTS